MTLDLFPDPDNHPYLAGIATLALLAIVCLGFVAGGAA